MITRPQGATTPASNSPRPPTAPRPAQQSPRALQLALASRLDDLHTALQTGDVEWITQTGQALIQHHGTAALAHRHRGGVPALVAAIDHDRPDALQALTTLLNDRRATLDETLACLNAQDIHGRKPFYQAFVTGDKDFVRPLFSLLAAAIQRTPQPLDDHQLNQVCDTVLVHQPIHGVTPPRTVSGLAVLFARASDNPGLDIRPAIHAYVQGVAELGLGPRTLDMLVAPDNLGRPAITHLYDHVLGQEFEAFAEAIDNL